MMTSSNLRSRGLLAATVLALVASATPGTVSANAQALPATSTAPKAAAPARTEMSCGTSKSMQVVTSRDPQKVISVGAWSNLAGATTRVTVQKGDCLIVTFSAEALCFNAPTADCLVRVLHETKRMDPADDFIHFDSVDYAVNSHRWVTTAGTAGKRDLQVQMRTTTTDAFQLDDWVLTVEVRRPVDID
jgi:hypothetical protein